MNLFDFLYSLLKDYHINGLYLIILLYIIIVPFWPFLFFLICRIKTLKIDKSGLLINTQAVEKKDLFSFLDCNQKPAITKQINKQQKRTWLFSGAAYYLGKGKDGRSFFIGYFGNDIPNGYKKLTTECETIVGVDWDNTPQWDMAYESVKRVYQLQNNNEHNVPSYNGNGARLNRKLHGIFACEINIPQ